MAVNGMAKGGISTNEAPLKEKIAARLENDREQMRSEGTSRARAVQQQVKADQQAAQERPKANNSKTYA